MSNYLGHFCFPEVKAMKVVRRLNNNVVLADDDGKGTFQRIPKKSFYWYQEVIRSNGAYK